MRIMNRIIVILILISIPLLQGLALVAGSAGYAEAKSRYSKLYGVYKSEIEKANIEKEKNGLPQEQIKEFNEWIKEQPLTANEIKIFKNFRIISPEDARSIKEREALKKRENKAEDSF